MESNALIVQGNSQENRIKAKLSQSCVQRSSFYVQWEKNGVWQLQFVAMDDGSTAYNLLTPQASIWYQEQEFIIKQPVIDYSSGFNTKTIVATHVYNECQFIVKRYVKTGSLTYRPSDIMNFVFGENQNGFTWEVKGNFEGVQIENFGNINGQDALKKIIEEWPDAIIYPSNRHIVVYQHDKFAKNYGHRLGYMYNTAEFKFTYDSTNITNQVWCIGKSKDKADGVPDDAPPAYFFDPFLVRIDDSIKDWTHGYPHEAAVISDDRFTDADSMRSYAVSSLTPEPTLVVEVTTTEHVQPIACDVVKCQIPEENISLDIELVSYTYYPWDDSQVNQITLNDKAKTIFDYNYSLRAKAYLDLRNLTSRLNTDVGQLQSTVDNQVQQSTDEIKKVKDEIRRANSHDTFGKNWIALGDSITEGYSPVPHVGNIGYPNQVKQMIELGSSINAGVDSGCFYNKNNPDLDSTKVVDEQNFARYDFATIAYGTNDFNINSDGAMIKSRLNYMVTKMRRDNPTIKIYGILPTRRLDYPGNIYEQNNGSYSFANLLECLRVWYRDNGITVLDWWNYNPVLFDNSNGLSSDKLHPNSEGYAMMSKQISDFIKSVY